MKLLSFDHKEDYWPFLLLLVLLLVWQAVRGRWPPGPPAWPLVGHLPWLGQRAHINLTGWGKRYGDILAVRFGAEDVVVLNSYRAFKEAYLDQSAQFSGKASLPLAETFSNNGKGIIFAPYGNAWKEQRKFVLRAMRLFDKETTINQEAATLVTSLLRHQGQPCNVLSDVALSVSNVISAFVFGRRFHPDDNTLKELVTSMNTITVHLGALGLSNAFPFLRKVPILRSKHVNKDIKSGFQDLRRFLASMADGHKQNFDPNNPRGLLGEFLLEIKRRADSGEKAGSFTDEQVLQTIFDVFIAGVDTVVSAFMWLVFYAARFPALQTAVQAELDRVLGGEDVSVASRRSLPVTEATVMEILRLATPSPLNFRATTCDVTLRDYNLPAGTWTLMNCWAVHRDPGQWTDPDRFDISRFLDGELRVITPPAWRPFGIGRRACPGERLARTELVVFFASMLQNFALTLHVPDGAPVPAPEDAVLGVALMPAAFHVCANPRRGH